MSLRRSTNVSKFAPTRSSTRKKRQGPLEKRRLAAKTDGLLQMDADQEVARESDIVYERDNIKYNKEKSLSELESAATERTNEGIFIFNPKEDKKSEEHEVLFEPLFNGESKEFVKLRFDAYKKCITKFNSAVQDTMRRLHKKFLLDISTFVFKSYTKHSSVTLLPTGIIFAGIDVSDHLETFQLISRSIGKLEGSTCAVAALSSQECFSLKNIIQLTVSQVLKNVKVTEPNMQHLVQWQRDVVAKTNSKPKIVILFEDFEHFDPQVLQDFILVCSDYAQTLQIVLLIGLATSIEAVHRQLSWSVSSKLETEKFHVLPTHEVLENLVTKLIISEDYCLKIGPKAFKFLCTNFDYCNLSINAFVRNMKFAILDFFYSNPLSFIHYTDVQKISPKLLTGHIERVRRWLFSHGAKKGDKATDTLKYQIEPPLSDKQLLDNKSVTNRFVGWIKQLETYHAGFSYALRCWIKLQLIHGIQTSYRKEYLSLLEKDNSRRFQLLMGQMTRNTDNISTVLKSWEKILKNSIALEEEYKKVDVFIKRIASTNNLDEEIESEDEDMIASMNISDDEEDIIMNNDHSMDFEDDLIIFNENLDSDPTTEKNDPTSELSVSFSFSEKEDENDQEVVILSDNIPVSQVSNNNFSDDEVLFEVNFNDGDAMEVEEDKISNLLKQTGTKSKNSKASKRKEALAAATATATAKPAKKVADSPQKMKSPEKPVNSDKKPRTLKKQIIDFISDFLKKHLAPLNKFPMYEAYYYNKKKIEAHLNPDLRSNIKLAMKKPKNFLACECCGDVVSHTWEDICIIYQFYQSSGRLVNIFDMYQHFLSIVNEKSENMENSNNNNINTTPHTKSNKKSPKKEKKSSGERINMDQKSDDVLMARFTQALNELKFMGLVDATSKKEDHVEKLV